MASEPGKKGGSQLGRSAVVPYVFVAPFFLLFAVFILYPVLYSLALSFSEWSAGGMTFVGLDNYQTLFTDGLFLKSLFNTALILFVQVPIMISLATVIAAVVDSDLLRHKTFFRLAFFLPVMVDLVTYSVIFSLIFSERYGIVVAVVRHVGLHVVLEDPVVRRA